MIYIDNFVTGEGGFGAFIITKSKSSVSFDTGDLIAIELDSQKYSFNILDMEPFHRNPNADHWFLKIDMRAIPEIDYQHLERTFRGYGEIIKP